MNFKALVATAMTVSLLAGPAFADGTKQVEVCKAFMAENDILDVDAYRFKYEDAKGGRVTIVDISVIPVAEGQAYKAECKIRSGRVEAVELIEV